MLERPFTGRVMGAPHVPAGPLQGKRRTTAAGTCALSGGCRIPSQRLSGRLGSGAKPRTGHSTCVSLDAVGMWILWTEQEREGFYVSPWGTLERCPLNPQYTRPLGSAERSQPLREDCTARQESRWSHQSSSHSREGKSSTRICTTLRK